jgi:hypothetical protein
VEEEMPGFLAATREWFRSNSCVIWFRFDSTMGKRSLGGVQVRFYSINVEEEMPGFLAATREWFRSDSCVIWFRFISCMHYRLYREEELRSGSGSILFF